MFRKILKWLGLLLLAVLVAMAVYLAMHVRAVSNMARVSGVKVTDVSRFTPAETVKGLPGNGVRCSARGHTACRNFSRDAGLVETARRSWSAGAGERPDRR